MTETDRKHLRTIALNIVNNDCVLFLGAGVNMNSVDNNGQYVREHRPPTGSELTDLFLDELWPELEKIDKAFEKRDKSSLNLSRVAQYYEHVNDGRLLLGHFLRRHINDQLQPSPKLLELATIPFQYIITTNYDKLFEKAFQATHNGNSPHVRVYRPMRNGVVTPLSINEINAQKPVLFKIHGDIDDEQSIVITDEDYITFIQRMRDTGLINPIPEVFNDALARKSILFIGYRLMDYNLRLLLKTIRWGQDAITSPRNYSVDPFPEPIISRISEPSYKTSFIVSDLWTVVPELKKMVDEEIKKRKQAVNV